MWKRNRDLHNKNIPASRIGKVKPAWRERIDDVKSCEDNAFIPRVPDAGVINGDTITMHNGIRIKAISYHGAGVMNMLVENKGVHEPQEERAFGAILPLLPEAPACLEMGAYWGFYSLWLKTTRPKASCHLIEPEDINLLSGKINFQMNGFDAEFENAFISNKEEIPAKGTPTTSVDAYCKRKQISHLHMLHSDIQGFELKMLEGAVGMFKDKKIDYVFISTHSDLLHRQCIAQMEAYGYHVLCSVDLTESHSIDGLIVAKSPLVELPHVLEVSKKKYGGNAHP